MRNQIVDGAHWAPALGALLLVACGGDASGQGGEQDDSSTGGGVAAGGQNAIGGSENPGDGGSGAADTGAGGVAPTGDGGSGGVAATGGAGSGGTVAGSGGTEPGADGPRLGQISAAVRLSDSLSSNLLVSFTWESYLNGSRPTSGECPRTPVGGCFIADCWTQQSSDDTGMDVRLEAGKIEFSVDNGMTFETAPQGDDNAYPAITNAGLAGGEHVSFTAEGGTVEAFSGSIQLPLAPMLLEPDVSGGGSQVVEVGVPSTQDLSLTWDVRGTSEWVVFQALGATDAPNFSCTFEAEPGGAIIPAEVLQHVGAGMEFSGVGANRDRIVLADGYVEVVAHFDMVNETRTVTPLFVVQ